MILAARDTRGPVQNWTQPAFVCGWGGADLWREKQGWRGKERVWALRGAAAQRGMGQPEAEPPGSPQNSPHCRGRQGTDSEEEEEGSAHGTRGICTTTVRASFKSQRGVWWSGAPAPAALRNKTSGIWGFLRPHAHPTRPHPEASAKSPQMSAAGAAAGCGQAKRASVGSQEGQEERKPAPGVSSHSNSISPSRFPSSDGLNGVSGVTTDL